MQGPTHLATGILIQKALKKVQPLPLQHLLVAFLAILSHGILDKLAKFTYHPSVPLTGDWFWISYHLIIAFLTIFMLIKYWRKYKLGLIFSVLPDFDWVVLYSSNFFSVQIPFWKEPILHKFLFSFLDLLPPFSFLNSLPDWSLERKGVILEFALLAILTTFIIVIEKKTAKPTLTVQEEKYTKSDNEIIPSGWIDKLKICLTCMDHEEKIRTSYQSLLTSLEVALFGLVFTLYQLKLTDHLWLLSMAGISLCLFFGIACEFRARNVDFWRMRIIILVKGTNLEGYFKGAKYGHPDDYHPFFDKKSRFGKLGRLGDKLFGHWFERILISSILIIWLVALWSFPSPFIIRLCAVLCGTLATCFWIIYAFCVIRLERKIIISK